MKRKAYYPQGVHSAAVQIDIGSTNGSSVIKYGDVYWLSMEEVIRQEASISRLDTLTEIFGIVELLALAWPTSVAHSQLSVGITIKGTPCEGVRPPDEMTSQYRASAFRECVIVPHNHKGEEHQRRWRLAHFKTYGSSLDRAQSIISSRPAFIVLPPFP